MALELKSTVGRPAGGPSLANLEAEGRTLGSARASPRAARGLMPQGARIR